MSRRSPQWLTRSPSNGRSGTLAAELIPLVKTGPEFTVEGHAIISDDDCICDVDGRMPACLKQDADWAYFQSHLDQAAIVIAGRHGHEAHPNKPGRKRLVFTSRSIEPFSVRGDVAFLDPSRHSLDQAGASIAPGGGVIAVTGGRPVFDWFAAHGGFDAFHLVRARGSLIPGGRPMFSGGPAETVLRALGLACIERRWLSEQDRVELLLYRRA